MNKKRGFATLIDQCDDSPVREIGKLYLATLRAMPHAFVDAMRGRAKQREAGLV
jgi:hypothetical protein